MRARVVGKKVPAIEQNWLFETKNLGTLCSCSLWRTDTIVFSKLNKPLPPPNKFLVSIKPLLPSPSSNELESK